MIEIKVAVGVLTDAAGRLLITRRAPNAHQGGLWEFPGGKVEVGESTFDALLRELDEELGIRVEASQPLLEIAHDYGDKRVRLAVHRVIQWQHEPRGQEGQPLAWVRPAELDGFEFPAANTPIIEALRSS